jgi:hypothetical protein
MYSDTHNTETSLPTPVYFPMAASAGEIMLEPKLAANATIPSWKVIKHLYAVDQFFGLACSFSSQWTRYGSAPSLTISSFEGGTFSTSVVEGEGEAMAVVLQGRLLDSKTRAGHSNRGGGSAGLEILDELGLPQRPAGLGRHFKKNLLRWDAHRRQASRRAEKRATVKRVGPGGSNGT